MRKPTHKCSLQRGLDGLRTTVEALKDFQKLHTPCSGCDFCDELPGVLWSVQMQEAALQELIDQWIAALTPCRRAS